MLIALKGGKMIKEHGYIEKNIYLFGAGGVGISAYRLINELGGRVCSFIDNRIGGNSRRNIEGVPIISVEEFGKINSDNKLVIVCSEKYQGEMVEQLEQSGIKNYVCINDIIARDADYADASLLNSQKEYYSAWGWFRSYITKEAVNAWGESIPWMTYPAIEFLNKRINSNMNAFEFSMGGSTDWFSRRVKHIISVEHDVNYFLKTQEALAKRENVELILREVNLSKIIDTTEIDDDNGYSDSINDYKKCFDIISIDGISRIKCTRNCIEALSDGGIIIFDNSEHFEYRPAYEYLFTKGFRELGFWGYGPVNQYRWKTSIFYRDHNCLNI